MPPVPEAVPAPGASGPAAADPAGAAPAGAGRGGTGRAAADRAGADPAGAAAALVDEVVAGADADPCVTRVRQALADSGAEADVVVLDHAPRSPEDLADELGVRAGALVRCHLLLVEAVDLAAPSATSYGGDLDEPSGAAPLGAPAGGEEVPRAVLVLAPQGRRVRAADVAEAVAGLGVDAVRHATAEEVSTLTGCSSQDLPPTGLQSDRLVLEAVLVDTALGDHAVLWAPAGRPGTALGTSYEELLRITLGHPVPLS